MLLRAGERISFVSEEIIKRNTTEFVSYYEMITEVSAQNMDCDIILADVRGGIISSTGVILKGKSVVIPEIILEKVSGGEKWSGFATIGNEKNQD